MLKVDSLVKKFGDFVAVNGVSFEAKDGECFGLLGPNGAGKTTTISMIAGVADPDSGDLFVNHVSSRARPQEVKRHIGYVPQELALYPEVDADENLRMFASLYGLFGAERSRRVDEALEMVGLKERRKEPISHFSGGMKRRLNIAAGILHRPDLLILDEPTVGIDPQSRNAIFDTLELLRAEGKTLLYTTHYMEEVERLCQRVAIMDKGKIVAQGDLRELKHSQCGNQRLTVTLKNELTAEQKGAIGKELCCSVNGPSLIWPVEDLTRDVPTILVGLEARGLQITSVKTSESSLEEIFLQTTGRSLRD